MSVQGLPIDQVDALRSAPFTYADVGATASTPPQGFDFFSRSRKVKHTEFDAAVEALMAWQVQRRAGLGDGHVEFTISAFSRPATRTARLGGPLTRRFQGLMTSRYLSSLDA